MSKINFEVLLGLISILNIGDQKQTKKLSFLRQTSQDFTQTISKILSKDQNSPRKKRAENTSLDDLYKSTFNVQSVKDLYNKNELKKSNKHFLKM